MNRVDAFLELVVKQNGSDLHIIAGNPPRLRLHGETHTVKYRELSAKETRELLFEIMNAEQREEYLENQVLDFSYDVPNLSRFRVNAFEHLNGTGIVFRVIPSDIQSLQQLGLPPILKNLARQRKGLILVTGPTGSGKSTTLAAMIDFVNNQRRGHILTIEDPVEFLHTNKKCLISQREIGSHTRNFASALHSALREDPDVILVGEMRDLETIHLALTAAEMGILVMATLHTSSAASSIERIINAFPPGEEPYVRTMLSTSLCGVVSQQLVRTADNRSRIAAIEIMINNAAVSNIIREGKTEQLDNVIQGGAMQGMQLMDTALKRLVESKKITGEQAFLTARNKDEFILMRDELEVEQEEQSVTSTDSINQD